ncbi:hypothetical protein DFH28DRAFT_830448, partial [Melampsora americana]
LCSLVKDLLVDFSCIYQLRYPNNNCYIRPHHMFHETHAWKIIKNYELLRGGVSLRHVFGSEPLKGTFEMIHDSFLKWSSRDNFRAYLLEAQHQAAR